MAAEKSTLMQEAVRGGVWGGFIAALRIASLNIFTLATANFLAGGVILGTVAMGTIHLLKQAFSSPQTA